MREEIIVQIQEIARRLGTQNLKGRDFQKYSKISLGRVYKFFGTWAKAMEAAGLFPIVYRNIKKEDLFFEMEKVFNKCGRVCTTEEFKRLSKYSLKPYQRQFGSWNKALSAYSGWVKTKDEPASQPLEKKHMDNEESSEINQGNKASPRKLKSGMTYGAVINFRGLQHAPVNEQGVVFLFGMLSSELGFIVEAVRQGFPDCEAKRRISSNPDRWERVTIEFEYESSSFKAHSHNPNECDLIICWVHDWKECSIEVIELQSEIRKLKS